MTARSMQLDGASTVEELKMAAEQLFGLQPGEVLLLYTAARTG